MSIGSAVTRIPLNDNDGTTTSEHSPAISDDATVKAANIRRVTFTPTLRNKSTDFHNALTMLFSLFNTIESDRRARARDNLAHDITERHIFDTNLYVRLGAPTDFDFGAIDTVLRGLSSLQDASTLAEMMVVDPRFSLHDVVLEPLGDVCELTNRSTATTNATTTDDNEVDSSSAGNSVDAEVPRPETDDECDQ